MNEPGRPVRPSRAITMRERLVLCASSSSHEAQARADQQSAREERNPERKPGERERSTRRRGGRRRCQRGRRGRRRSTCASAGWRRWRRLRAGRRRRRRWGRCLRHEATMTERQARILACGARVIDLRGRNHGAPRRVRCPRPFTALRHGDDLRAVNGQCRSRHSVLSAGRKDPVEARLLLSYARRVVIRTVSAIPAHRAVGKRRCCIEGSRSNRRSK
jgi:hypothetical protein